jgi:hypothetical protein
LRFKTIPTIQKKLKRSLQLTALPPQLNLFCAAFHPEITKGAVTLLKQEEQCELLATTKPHSLKECSETSSTPVLPKRA